MVNAQLIIFKSLLDLVVNNLLTGKCLTEIMRHLPPTQEADQDKRRDSGSAFKSEDSHRCG